MSGPVDISDLASPVDAAPEGLSSEGAWQPPEGEVLLGYIRNPDGTLAPISGAPGTTPPDGTILPSQVNIGAGGSGTSGQPGQQPGALPARSPSGAPSPHDDISDLADMHSDHNWVDELGIGTRNLIEGVGSLPDIVAGPLNVTTNALLGTHLGTHPFGDAATGIADDLGLPVPETNEEKLLSSINRGAAGGLATGGTEAIPAGIAALSGAGAGGASELVRQHGGTPLEQFGAGLAGGFLAPGGVAAYGRMAPVVARAADPVLAGFSNAAARRVASRTIAGSATDLPSVMEAIRNGGSDELVPGSSPTLYQATGDTGIGGLERRTATANPVPFIERENAQNAARVSALGDLQSSGDPMAVQSTLKAGLDALDHETSADVARATMDAQAAHEAVTAESRARVAQATERAQGHAAAIPETTPQANGQAIRDAAEKAEQAASTRARGLYNAIDPDGTLTANTQRTSTAARDLVANEPATAKPMTGEEAAIFDAAANMNPVSPARDLVAMSQRVNAAMRQELMQNGRTPTYARLSQLRGAIQDNLTNTISDAVVHDNAMVAKGDMAPDDAVAARIQKWRDEYVSAKQAGTFGREGAVGSTGVGATASSGNDGAGFSPQGGLGSSAGDQGVSGGASEGVAPENPTFDDAARDRLLLANSVYRAKMGTFGRGPLNDILRKAGMSDVYRLPAEAVPAKVWTKGPVGQANAQALIKGIGEGPATEMLTDVAAASLRKAALRDDGTINPVAYAKWRNDYSEALKALPSDIQAKFGLASQASGDAARTVAERALADKAAAKIAAQTIQQAEVARTAQMAAAQQGAVGRIMGATDPVDVSRMVGSMLGRNTSVTEMRDLASRMQADPVAMDGLRQAVADHINEKFISATNGDPLKAAQFQTFLRDKRAALAQVFSKDQLQGMDAIAADLKRAQMSQSGARLKNASSATAQDSVAARMAASGGLRRTMLALIADHAGGFGAGIGTVALDALRSAGIRNANDLVTRALLDPSLAQELLKNAPAQGAVPSMTFSKALLRSTVSAGLATR